LLQIAAAAAAASSAAAVVVVVALASQAVTHRSVGFTAVGADLARNKCSVAAPPFCWSRVPSHRAVYADSWSLTCTHPGSREAVKDERMYN